MKTTTSRMIGASVPRREDNRLLTGQGRFLDDLELPDALSAAFLRSPHAHARIRALDLDAARRMSGVVAAFSGADLMAIQQPLAPKVLHPDLIDFPRLPMPPEEVHYVGEPVAIVIAESRYLAEDALELIDVDYQALPAVASTAAALAENAPMAHSGAHSNVAVTLLQRSGNATRCASKTRV